MNLKTTEIAHHSPLLKCSRLEGNCILQYSDSTAVQWSVSVTISNPRRNISHPVTTLVRKQLYIPLAQNGKISKHLTCLSKWKFCDEIYIFNHIKQNYMKIFQRPHSWENNSLCNTVCLVKLISCVQPI